MWLFLSLGVIALVIVLAHFLPKLGAKPLSNNKMSKISGWVMVLVFVMLIARAIDYWISG